MTENFSPAVSVIIPMYNAEKYLPVCLESILNQTFTDFELLVVDDCSTDSSYAIAESYLEKFGGRLKIISLPENTGSGAVPRNVGLDLSRGKYVYFIDNDDFIVDNALETLYNFAEKYQADFVYMEKYFLCDEEPATNILGVATWKGGVVLDKILVETDDVGERVRNFINAHFYWPPWAKFVRRDFLVDNGLKFLPMKISEDIIWTFQILCLAKKILRIPTTLYVHRANLTSIMRRDRTPEQTMTFWLNPLLTGVDYLNTFMNELDYFKQNIDARFQILDLFVVFQLNYIADDFTALGTNKAYEIFLREFSEAGSPNAALISYLFVMNNSYRNELMKRKK